MWRNNSWYSTTCTGGQEDAASIQSLPCGPGKPIDARSLLHGGSTLSDSSQFARHASPTEESHAELPVVAVVIVHWINMADTVECLESLSGVDYPNMLVVVVNNGSKDFDGKRLRESCPSALVVTSAENLGVTRGNNLGVDAALASGADMILFLNPDTIVRSDLIQSLLPAFLDRRVGVVGPVITYYDNPGVVWSAGGRYDRLVGHPRTLHLDAPLTSVCETREVDWLSCCAMMATRDMLEEAGPFWEDLFMYFDDSEFCLRVRRAGYKCVAVGKPLVLHKVSAAGGIRGSNRFSSDKAYYFGRNPFLVFRRHPGGLWIIPSVMSQFVVVLPYMSVRNGLAKSGRLMASYLCGMWDGIRGRRGKRGRTVRS